MALVAACAAAPTVQAMEPTAQAADPVQPGPIVGDLAEAKWAQMRAGTVPLKPQGTNDPACRVDEQHPEAIILVHGTDSTFYSDFAALAPALVADGWCVYGLDYGLGDEPSQGFGWASMRDSAVQLDRVVRAARASSGAQRVRLVGFSQGATMSRWWINQMSQPGEVAQWIGVASPTRGGSFWGLARFEPVLPQVLRDAFVGPALRELVAGSDFMRELNAQGELREGVEGLTIGTVVDEMMPERDNQALLDQRAPHVWVQQVCPGDLGGHMYLTFNPTVIDVVRGAVAGKKGEELVSGVRCAPVGLGHAMVRISVADNLRKLGLYPTRRHAVSYGLD